MDGIDNTSSPSAAPASDGVAGGGGDFSSAAAPAAAGNETFQPAQTTPPHSWSRHMHEHWSAIPEPARQYISRRESEAHKAITGYGEQVKRYETLEPVLAQHRPYLEQRGIAPEQAFDRLVRAQMYYEQNPEQAAMQLMPPERRAYYGSLEQQYNQAQTYARAVEQAYIAREQQLAVEAKRAEEAKHQAKVADALKAARLNVRSTPVARENPKTMDETIAASWDKIHGLQELWAMSDEHEAAISLDELAARRRNVTRHILHRLCRSGRLPYTTVDGQERVKPSDYDAYAFALKETLAMQAAQRDE